MELETQSAKPKPGISDIGFSTLHDPQDAIVDIIFVHGLQGHPRKTWTCENVGPQGSVETLEGSHRGIKKLFLRNRRARIKDAHKFEASEVFWPFDLLPDDCGNARILTWGYDSKVSHFFGGATNQSNITAHARNLLHALKIRRLNCQGRSLIFVAHSLGGIIVKDVLRRAATEADPALLDIYTSVEAIIFLGTPHRGSSKAGIAEVVRKIVSVSGFDTTDQNIRALQINSAELELIHELFMKLYDQKDRRFQVLTFQEAKGVVGISYLKMNERVVEPFSSYITATEPIQTINANHMAMCRFPSKEDEGYKQVSGEIQILISRIQERLDTNERNREISNLQIRTPSQTTASSTSYSLNDIERKCIALLTQRMPNVAEYKSSLPTRVEGTCQWILSNSQYHDWNFQSVACLLWISGYPGSGKTILSAYLLENLGAGEYSPSMHTTLCYFFCDEKIDTQRDGTAILKSLIHQLLMRRRLLVKYVKAAYDIQGPHFDQNFNELWRIFIAIASDKRVGPISVIIDAIDECEETTRERFLRYIAKFVAQSGSPDRYTPCIKFLVTSRPLLGRQYTTNLLQIDPSQNHVEQDLRLLIHTKVEEIVQRTRCKPDIREYLENILYSKADRTFLWVTLVLHHLEKSLLASQKDFKRIIDQLPRDLTSIYEHFLNGIPIEYQTLATRLLHLLVGSSRPLTLEEMRILIAIQDHRSLAAIEDDAQPNIQKTIEGVLGPLVRIWDSRIYLVHQSLKDFLQELSHQSENPLSAIYGVDTRKAGLLIAERCISYLLLDDFKQDLFSRDQSSTEESPTSPVAGSTELRSVEQFWETFDLEEDTIFKDPSAIEAEVCASIAAQYSCFDYAARHWAEHFSLACSISPLELQKPVAILSDASNFPGANWFRFHWYHAELDLSCPQDFVPIVTASYHGHSRTLEYLLRSGFPLELDTGVRALYWASRMGHHDVVDQLLQRKVNPDVKAVNGQTALIAAVQLNRLDVVRLFLQDDGFIPGLNEYRVNYAATGGRTPLSIAAGNGFTEVVNQLLQHSKIKPDIADFDQWTPLFWSIGGRHMNVLKLLLADRRVSVNHVDRLGRNALSWAASAGELSFVRYLLSLKHLKADEADRNGRTCLSWAAGNGHLETVAYLRRSQRIALSKKDNTGRNALSWACSGGHYRVVEYLIKYDRQGVDEEDVDGWTPLAWALFSQSPKTVQVLVDSRMVNVNKKDNNGRSALSFAAGYGYLDVVQILLSADGIEIDSKDNDGKSPLSHAARHPKIVEVFQHLQK